MCVGERIRREAAQSPHIGSLNRCNIVSKILRPCRRRQDNAFFCQLSIQRAILVAHTRAHATNRVIALRHPALPKRYRVDFANKIFTSGGFQTTKR